MFRRLSSSLPPDFAAPADLTSLGYYHDESDDRIRSIEPPHHDFNAFISRSERKNEVHTEAYHECIRRIVLDRLESSSLRKHCLEATSNISTGNSNGEITPPSVPILHSTNLHSSRRNILFFGENVQDLGIFAYRVIGQEGINKGSAVDFANAVLHPRTHSLTNGDHSSKPVSDGVEETKKPTAEDRNSTGLVVANCGQLLWHPPTAKTMTQPSWHAQKRESAAHEAPSINAETNRIPGQENVEAHVKAVFDFYTKTLAEHCPDDNDGAKSGDKKVSQPKINIIAIGDGAAAVTEYLNKYWDVWRHKVATIAIGDGYTWNRPYLSWSPDFQKFFANRARIYLLSPEPLNTPLPDDGNDEDFGAPCYSSGEEKYTECIMVRAWRGMLEWFERVEKTPGYCQVQINGREM